MHRLKYRVIAERLANQIQDGTLTANERLPAIRTACQQFSASVTTIQSAYQYLEQQNLIVAKANSGFYVLEQPNTQTIALEAPSHLQLNNSMFDILTLCQQPHTYNFGTAELPPQLLPLTHMQKTLHQLTRYHIHELVQTHYTSGDLTLRKQIAKHVANVGVHLHPDELIITSGCQDAIALALSTLCQTGDVVAVESPCFPGFLQVCSALKLKVIEIPCHLERGMSLEALEMALASWPIKALLIAPSFSNPTGSLMPEDERHRLCQLAEQFDFTIIEDDLYSELNFSGATTLAIKHFDHTNKVIYCSSVSKIVGSGFRLGWIAPGKHYAAIMQAKAFRNISEPLISQKLIAELMQSGRYQKHVKQLRKTLQQNFEKMHVIIKTHFPAQTRISQPKGGLVVWVALPTGCDSSTLLDEASKQHIAFFPGEVFCERALYQHCFRLSFALNWTEQTERKLKQLGELVYKQIQNAKIAPC